jgi:XTP/dITP diphosphohydrolase
MAARRLILGTRNHKKAAELRQLLAPHAFALLTLDQVPSSIEVEETGSSFAENACLKASLQAAHLRNWVVGEDSGLAVDALDGAPGVYSARFSGPQATDQTNNTLLLEKLSGVPLERRGAHYVCHVALADPQGRVRLQCQGHCRGRIRTQPAGTGGFGYDPLFEIVEYHQTFGQLGPVVKSVLSHRGRALRQFIPRLMEVLRENDGGGDGTTPRRMGE